jgi:4-aminobutyrate aminotransferase
MYALFGVVAALQAVTKAAAARGMLLMAAGARESIRLLPPLVLTQEEGDMALHILEDSIQEVLRRHSSSYSGL